MCVSWAQFQRTISGDSLTSVASGAGAQTMLREVTREVLVVEVDRLDLAPPKEVRL